jgi:CRP-like cAMP-binding protein
MSLERDISLLSRLAVFKELSAEHLKLLAFSSARRELVSGQKLFEEGEAAASGFVVASGDIELAQTRAGSRHVLGACGPGSLIGEIALFIETRRPVTATAAVDSEVIEVTRALVLRMLQEYPQLAVRLRTMLSRRLTGTIGQLERVRATLDGLEFSPPRS